MPSRIEKTINETFCLSRPRRGAILKEEVWQNSEGEVVRYSLAYIHKPSDFGAGTMGVSLDTTTPTTTTGTSWDS